MILHSTHGVHILVYYYIGILLVVFLGSGDQTDTTDDTADDTTHGRPIGNLVFRLLVLILVLL